MRNAQAAKLQNFTPGQMKKGKVNSANFALRFINSLYGVNVGDLQHFKKNNSFICGDLLAFWKI